MGASLSVSSPLSFSRSREKHHDPLEGVEGGAREEIWNKTSVAYVAWRPLEATRRDPRRGGIVDRRPTVSNQFLPLLSLPISVYGARIGMPRLHFPIICPLRDWALILSVLNHDVKLRALLSLVEVRARPREGKEEEEEEEERGDKKRPKRGWVK